MITTMAAHISELTKKLGKHDLRVEENAGRGLLRAEIRSLHAAVAKMAKHPQYLEIIANRCDGTSWASDFKVASYSGFCTTHGGHRAVDYGNKAYTLLLAYLCHVSDEHRLLLGVLAQSFPSFDMENARATTQHLLSMRGDAIEIMLAMIRGRAYSDEVDGIAPEAQREFSDALFSACRSAQVLYNAFSHSLLDPTTTNGYDIFAAALALVAETTRR